MNSSNRLTEEYRLEYFENNDFVRRKCPSCGDHFWTRDETRETCGEPPCADYAFLDDPGFDEAYTLKEMRETLLSFFEERGHDRIDPYPVAANRWRDDVLLTQASIYGFQPHVTSGASPPPANPLVVSQPCIRMVDVDNVGKTGRHMTAFEMLGHHVFNASEDAEYAYRGEVYWKEECVEHCEQLLATLGADLDDVTYIEDVWVGGGNAGPSIEVIYRGLELATLVFMQLELDPDGEYELKDGNTYAKMDRRVIDPGYGVERLVWMSQGTPTVYEAIYPETIESLKTDAGIEHTPQEAELVHRAETLAGYMDLDKADDVDAARDSIARDLDVSPDRLADLLEPLENIYALADHSRALAYMLGDGIVPSNVGTGYLARMVLRRALRLHENLRIETPLTDLIDAQAERLGYENRETIHEMVRSEVEQYAETVERGSRKVRHLSRTRADEDDPIQPADLVELYDSHGIQPETVEEIASGFDVSVNRPDDFLRLVAERHEEGRTVDGDPSVSTDELVDLAETDRLYYDDPEATTFEASVLDVFGHEDGYDVVLDRTVFYPEGGGQPADRGTLSTDKVTTEVVDVQSREGVVVHRTDTELGVGETVHGRIDADRRERLRQHHTATHVIGHAARAVLGNHVRQAGAQKGTTSSRIDVRHYERLTREQVKRIERRANDIVTENTTVQQEWSDRHVAEAEHGFDIYQGGFPTGETIRLLHVDEDVQACAGTHVARTGDIGTIKILNTERVQDGVERITFAAGTAAIEHIQTSEDSLLTTAATFDVAPSAVPATAERFFMEWKERGKQIEDLKDHLAKTRAVGEDGTEVDVAGRTAVVRRLDVDMESLQATANALVDEGKLAVLGSGTDGAQFVVAVPDGVNVDAGAVVEELAATVGGGGGGPPDFAQGGGPAVGKLDEALTQAVNSLR